MLPENEVVHHAHILISQAEQAILQASKDPKRLQEMKIKLKQAQLDLNYEAAHATNDVLPLIQQAQQQIEQVLQLTLTRQQQGQHLH